MKTFPRLGWVLFLALVLLAIFPEKIAPYDPKDYVGRPLSAPSAAFLLGTNDIGQDLLSELIWGTRASLSTGLIVAALAVTLGSLVGIYSGVYSGWTESLLMRLVDITLVLPYLPLVILVGAYLGPGQRNVVLVLTLVSWAGPARLIRSGVLALRGRPYIEAARALGSSSGRIIFRHLLPGVRNLILTQVVLVASLSILAEASLSFLGLGDPSAKSWGTMLYFARASGAFLGKSWQWWVLPAGGMIALTVISLALISYGLEIRPSGNKSR